MKELTEKYSQLCPFCAQPGQPEKAGPMRRIVCQGCGAAGPLALTDQEAWRLWGIRPFADALTQALEAAPKSGGEMITDFFGQRG